ncbi:cysteine--1-D-myo-inosityl 2-amino-2-deoxy-alpha-D-glucopyranoside ligase [Microlunatus parietis]|uniref:L-cysteine:1D-myo-inositol 2-amino-2-deoxy-alpha-D-glucopyranoside ligase n=1 Tax=Microlunatus parietis TaxID=682979 RepID=A0A7Y9I3P0_9ACTN|nr:cysteine--1-D-myo-inosityl 2-amino-2-deoxy-alpha-D-glucopyranoside ligase [Microlunatus parietis]NYE69680.1 L-cysteine:1D-myo-inositol 2-amino-2-deoxy-alpha-D-glucopyranoside ligase [Microlunatus parietis]
MQAWRAPGISRLPGSDGTVSVYDTSSGAVVPVGPTSGTARMYVCGITPYDATHLGHANTYVAFDLLNRSWRDAGLEVAYVQNVTDVDDPLLERAEQTGVDWADLAEEQTELFRTDLAALNVLPPDHLVGAVESIDEVVALIEKLREIDGAIYPVADPEYPDLYFARAADGRFGSLSKLGAEAVAIFAENGGDPDRAGKKDPLDCLVWRLARDGEPSWESVLGAGRPGWHIECTAIALRYLGPEFDVQGGGRDLIFPHHEMCAAEGRVATGREFAKAYVHSGMVALNGEKMSKSKGNLELVSRLRGQGADPMAIRLALLSQHYRADWSWTPDLLTEATERLDQWREAVRRDAGVGAAETLAKVREALRNDLDAPAAVAAIDAWAGASLTIDGDDAEGPALIASATDALLGIRLS